jgi:diaminopimelate epimerase
MVRFGRAFYKLSGSGNDFVAFDEMHLPAGAPEPTAETVRALCRRGMGVGADGVVLLRPAAGVDYQLVYYNADGTRATLCGNASLCGVRLAVELGHADPAAVRFLTDAGLMLGRLHDGLPEIDVASPTEVQLDRRDLLGGDLGSHGDPSRVGYARVGVPHVVVLCGDASTVDVERAGPPVRRHASLHDGANVNYVSRLGDGRWMVRTYERGVEAETLACGTGSVATATLLGHWGEVGGVGASGSDGVLEGGEDRSVEIVTRSGLVHRVRRHVQPDGTASPSLSGSAAIVFRGELGEGSWAGGNGW